MNTLDKLAGTKGCFLVVGHTEAVIPEGYAAYGMIVRVDGTIVATFDHVVAGALDTVTDQTWESVALAKGDYIPFEYPVVAITLTADTDSILLYLDETDYVAPEE